ncbi:4-alpha-glucanotransferase [Labeo rohita]|uniref:4-alpha-glucanotransferase n=1 Tax=Labeo rohita TaxID=84645 RepID=A0ABQ8L7Q8_LABRO|nr:4-alpha-glucanotransferase [Labeo rohita]
MSCPERIPVSMSSPEGAPALEFSPERAPVSKSNPKKDSVPKSCHEKVSVPKGSPESLEAHKCPPYHPIMPPSMLMSGSSSAHPLSTICPPSVRIRVQDSTLACRPSDSTVVPSSLPSAVARQSTGFTGLPPAPPWSGIDHPTSRDSVPLAPSGFSIPPAPPWSSVALAPLWPPGSTLPHQLSVSATGSSTTCSTTTGQPPGVVSPSCMGGRWRLNLIESDDLLSFDGGKI